MRALTPVLACSLLCIASASADDAATTSAAKSAVLDKLAGTWNVRYEFVDKTGQSRVNNGQVQYTWILDGKALQEVWTSDSESKDPRPFGTTINFYDPKRQQWTAVWVYPSQGETFQMTGGDVSGNFVLTGHDRSGALQRWSTSLVTADSVIGRFDISRDEGKTWKEVGVNHMERASAGK